MYCAISEAVNRLTSLRAWTAPKFPKIAWTHVNKQNINGRIYMLLPLYADLIGLKAAKLIGCRSHILIVDEANRLWEHNADTSTTILVGLGPESSAVSMPMYATTQTVR